MNATRMWHLIAELVATYAQDGDDEQAMSALKQALTTEPMWIPNALFDPRTERLRGRDDFRALTTLPSDDGPAHFNAALVALEYGDLNAASQTLAAAFRLAEADGSLPFLLEALDEDDTFQRYRAHSAFTTLTDRYRKIAAEMSA